MSNSVKNMMREVMVTAWQICRTTGESFSECLKRAWMNSKLKRAMKNGIVRFAYIKKTTGEIRHALGTLDPHRYEYDAVGGPDYKPADCVRYWDCEAHGWRMYKLFNLVSVSL